MLSVSELSVHYKGICALQNLSLRVHPGEVVAVIGANGAGKSTLLNAIMGLAPKSNGEVHFKEQAITTIPTEMIVKRGISLVPESRELFPQMTCRDNLRMGVFWKKTQGEIEKLAEPVFDLFPRLRERLDQKAGTLSGGEQQMLAIGRALMQEPSLLLLDEPSFGLSPKLTDDLFRQILRIRDAGSTVILVEQKGKLALEIANRGYILKTGKIVLSGTASELVENNLTKKAFFGE